MLALYVERFPNANFFEGKIISIGGSLDSANGSEKMEMGDISAIIMSNLPIWAEWKQAAPMKTVLLPDYEQKLEEIAQKTQGSSQTSPQCVQYLFQGRTGAYFARN